MHPLTQTIDLVRRAQDGDGGALDALFARYYERVRQAVRARLGARLRTRMESGDILQQTFLTACRCFDRFEMRDEGSFIHWLSKLAENQIRDAAKNVNADLRNPDREVPMDRPVAGASGEQGMDLPADATGILGRLAKEEDRHHLEAALDLLAPHYREVIVLRDIEGMSWADVAAQTERPSPDAARMLHAKAMAELTAHLPRKGGAGGTAATDGDG